MELARQLGPAAEGARQLGREVVQIVRRLGPPAVEIARRPGLQAAQGAATPWATFNPDDRRACNRSEVVRAWAVAAAAEQVSAVAEVEVVAAVAVAAVVAAAVGRRSDIRLKHDITLLGRLDDGLGFYRFAYNGSDKAYVGVMAQEVQTVEPEAVVVGRDGYFRVLYGQLGFKMQTYDQWIASGARIPSATQIRH